MPSSNPSGSMPPSEQPSNQPSLSGAPSIQQSLSPSESSAPSEQPSLSPSESLKPSVSAEPSSSSQPSGSNQPSNSPSIEFCQPRVGQDGITEGQEACNTEEQLRLASAGSCIGIQSCFNNVGNIGINSCTGEDSVVGGVSACEDNEGEIGEGSW